MFTLLSIKADIEILPSLAHFVRDSIDVSSGNAVPNTIIGLQFPPKNNALTDAKLLGYLDDVSCDERIIECFLLSVRIYNYKFMW